MKKLTSRSARSKQSSRRSKGEDLVEFDRGWQELEAQADKLKYDWGSLAAVVGGGSRGPKFDR